MSARPLPLAAAAILLAALAGCAAGTYGVYDHGSYYGGYGDPYYVYGPALGYGGTYRGGYYSYYGVPSRAYLYLRHRDRDHDHERHRHARWRDREDGHDHHHKRWRDRDDDRDGNPDQARDRDRHEDDDRDRRGFREPKLRDDRSDRRRAAPHGEDGYRRRGAIARSAERRAREERSGVEAGRAALWRDRDPGESEN